MPDYVVEALSQTAISDAFPIMHLTMPKLDLQAWQRFAGLRWTQAGPDR
jgi:hypothetical protein